jgi:hypothetical protein
MLTTIHRVARWPVPNPLQHRHRVRRVIVDTPHVVVLRI